mgnify:CR=1 FL=1
MSEEQNQSPKTKKSEALWLMSFSDMSLVLIAFFVILVSTMSPNKNKFEFMKEGFDWEQEQDNDMEEIDMEKVYMEVDDLWDAYRETGMRPSDFISEID